MAYVTLFDKNFKALGSKEGYVGTQHITKSWSLKRRAFEFDDFSVTCRGFRDSKNACFVGLYSDEGTLKYVCFCGIPKTENELTTITGIDCRNIFNQTLPINLASSEIKSEKSLYTFLLKTALGNLNVGIDYEIDTGALNEEEWEKPENYIERTLDSRNLWELIQAANAMDLRTELQKGKDDASDERYGTKTIDGRTVTVSWIVDEETNNYKLVFKVLKYNTSMVIKLADYDVRTVRTNNITNIAIAATEDFSASVMYYLTNDNDVLEVTKASGIDPTKALFPPKAETYTAETIEEAMTDARQALYDNRFKDRVTIACNSRLGKKLEGLSLNSMGWLVGYNPADDSSVKILPVSAIEEDYKGSRKIEFGRLSEYWFLN